MSTPISAADVPDDLSERDQWVLWRFEKRAGTETKVPYQTNGRPASSTDPSTWADLESVISAWRRSPARYAGVGFVFSPDDPYAGIDLDDSLDDAGIVKPWTRGVVERFADTYTEVSPSGRGLKIWARGSLPANVPGVAVGDGQIEMYDRGRHFAVTGRAFRGAPFHVEEHISDLAPIRILYPSDSQAGSLHEPAVQPLKSPLRAG
jgi:primase-polymerase (primpol)-like protein